MPLDDPLDQPIDAAFAPSPDAAAEITSWLVREARFLPGNKELLEGFCERVSAAGIPIDRVSLHQRAFHPQYRGVSRIWYPDRPLDEKFLDHGIERTATYIESPVRLVVEEGQSLDWHLEGKDLLPFPVLDELRDQGYTQYVMQPLIYGVGLINAFSWATRRPGGFTSAETQFIHDLMPAYAAVAEAKALFRFVNGMLSTYVGEEAGRLILDGQVRRGDVREITAALMLFDLRDFTALSDQLNPRAVLRLLNSYFDCVMPPVQQQGGEVVEIMGDGVLAIFNHGPERSAEEACNAALAAAQAGFAALAERNRKQPGTPLQAGVALHYGTVSYGNIGSGTRLDFTVIGPDVNLTARIERLCRELDRSLIMSEVFAQTVDRPTWEIGHFELRGFAKMQRLFELPPG
ncbi:MAG TPA: adenylate/guanylate cyclase domain-containing protein [Stellaceae bacterium]|jgi:adenylate cyclase|nr:adenylate/guanylate cyclase domain-containing protein [Stellaceae bacterium]